METTNEAKTREIEACRKMLAKKRNDAWWTGYLTGNIARLEREIAEAKGRASCSHNWFGGYCDLCGAVKGGAS